MSITRALGEIVASYDPDAPLERASTIPGEWYTDGRVLDLERQTAFARSWQVAARVDQLRDAGSFVSCELPAGELVRELWAEARRCADRPRRTWPSAG